MDTALTPEPLRIDLRQPPFAEPKTSTAGTCCYRVRDFEEVQRAREWSRELEQLRQHAAAWSHIWMYATFPVKIGVSLTTNPGHALAEALGWTDGPLPAFIEEYARLLGGFHVE